MYKQMVPTDVAAKDKPSESSTVPELPISGNGGAPQQQAAGEWQERCLRLAAEFDNFKKRSARDNDRRAAEQKHAFVRELLPVVDNLERALASNPAQSAGSLHDGVEITLRHLLQVLQQHGFTGRDDLAQPFDPHFQEAVSVRSEPLQPDQIVLEVWQRGWLHGQAMFRPAKVVVNDLKRDQHDELQGVSSPEQEANDD